MSSFVGFIGIHELLVDAKGRVSIPSRFKAALKEHYGDDGTQVIVRPSLDLNLVVEPPSEFAKMADDLERFDDLHEETRRLQEMLISRATLEKIDSAGRIRLSPHLRKLAGLRREVTCVGKRRSFEIWNRERWNASEAQTLSDPRDLARKVRAANRPAS